MKKYIIVLLVIGMVAYVYGETNTTIRINSSDIGSNVQVIGKLGVPLGQIIKVKGTIVSGDELKLKGYASEYLIKVTAVDGKALEKPKIMEFYILNLANVSIANNHFALYKLKTGEEAGMLDEKQIAKLEKGYVGSHVTLLVYETGGFSGIPNNMPRDFPIWQDHSFYFSTHLAVLKDESQSKQK